MEIFAVWEKIDLPFCTITRSRKVKENASSQALCMWGFSSSTTVQYQIVFLVEMEVNARSSLLPLTKLG